MKARILLSSLLCALALPSTTRAEAGGGWAFGAAVPCAWVEIEGHAQRIGPGGVPRPVFSARDTEVGIGDMTIIPFSLSRLGC